MSVRNEAGIKKDIQKTGLTTILSWTEFLIDVVNS